MNKIDDGGPWHAIEQLKMWCKGCGGTGSVPGETVKGNKGCRQCDGTGWWLQAGRPGASVRTVLAGMAMQGLLARDAGPDRDPRMSIGALTAESLIHADALISELNRGEEEAGLPTRQP